MICVVDLIKTNKSFKKKKLEEVIIRKSYVVRQMSEFLNQKHLEFLMLKPSKHIVCEDNYISSWEITGM